MRITVQSIGRESRRNNHAANEQDGTILLRHGMGMGGDKQMKHTNTQIHKHSNTQTHVYTHTQNHKHKRKQDGMLLLRLRMEISLKVFVDLIPDETGL